MKITAKWNDKLNMSATAGGHTVAMDTKPPLGANSAMTPKELVAAGLCGCAGMDVVSLLRKYRQPLEAFEVEAEIGTREESHPNVFTSVDLTFRLRGAVDRAKAIEAVRLSQTKYCSVSAMLAKAVPIHYSIEVNGEEIATGEAKFE